MGFPLDQPEYDLGHILRGRVSYFAQQSVTEKPIMKAGPATRECSWQN
jgi:hypothetical protein